MRRLHVSDPWQALGCPLTANSLDELARMSFSGLVFEECPFCGEPHDFDGADSFLVDDEFPAHRRSLRPRSRHCPAMINKTTCSSYPS